MANSLYRSGYTTVIPGTPAVAPSPAYTAVVPETHQEPVYGTQLVPGLSGNGHVIQIPIQVVIGYRDVTVLRYVFHPATPGSPGTPPRRIDVPPLGWTSFAYSVPTIRGLGQASFKIRRGVAGAVVGFSTDPVAPTSGYGHIYAGLGFAGNVVSIARTGAVLGTFVEGDEFTVLLTPAGVSFLKNASPIGADTVPPPAGAVSYLAAALFAPSDEVYDPELLQTGVGATSETAMHAWTATAAQDAYVYSAALMSAWVADIPAVTHAHAQMSRWAAYAARGHINGATGRMAPWQVLAYQSNVVAVPNTRVTALMSPWVTAALAAQSALCTAEVAMSRWTTLAADSPYAEVKGKMSNWGVLAYQFPPGEVYAYDVATSVHYAIGTTTLLAVVMEGITVAVSAVPDTIIDAAIQELITLTPSVAVEQLLEVAARNFILAGATSVLEGVTGRTDQDTWVWHADAEGSTRYRSYPFNSFAEIGGRYYGASSDGVFLLEGENDAGAPIRASIDLGQLDFGTAERKTITQCYLGVSAKGNLFLKVIAEGQEYVYKTRNFSEHMQQQRITTGKGLRTNYITAQFFNEDGADFEIDTVRFVVADLKRRIN